MPWKEVAPGHYERPLDATEKFIKAASFSVAAYNREHWTVNTIANLQFGSLNTEDAITALQCAWIQTRYHHPFIASLLEDTKHTYHVADESSLAKWVSESFFVENGTIDSFLVNVRPKKYSSIHYFPASLELLMRSHHWTVDGIGSLILMNKFFQYLSVNPPAPAFGNEWKNLGSGFSEAAEFPTEYTQATEEQAQKTFMGFVEGLPSIGLPFETPSQGLGGTKCMKKPSGFPIAKSLAAACKCRGVSVASAVHAAITVATQEMKTELSAAKYYTSVASYNYRPYLPALFNDAENVPIGCYMLALPFSRPPADFATHAKEFQKVYHQPLQRDEFQLFKAYDMYASKMEKALSHPPPPGMPLPTQPYLSSIGVIDGRVKSSYQGMQNITISHVEIVADVMTPEIVVYQWSWQGKFFLSANYNEAFYKDDYVQSFLVRVQEIIFEELGIDAED